MNEYEALDLLEPVLGNMWTVSQFGFGLISAYCLLAYYIGAKLTLLQVTFVNICFFVMMSTCSLATFSGTKRLRYLLDSLPDTVAEAVFIPMTSAHAFSAFITFGTFILIGCYLFMWSIRHPKTE